MVELRKFYPALGDAWTDREVLPGGESNLDSIVANAIKHYPGLPIDYLQRLARRYGSRIEAVLGNAKSLDDLGGIFGAGATMLSEREIEYAVREEWAATPDDILWRRTKCGLHMDVAERERASRFISTKVKR